MGLFSFVKGEALAINRQRQQQGQPMAAGQADRGSGESLGEEERGEEGEAWRRLRRCYVSPPPPRRVARSPPRRAAGPLHPCAAGTPPRTSLFVVHHCVYDSLRSRGRSGVMAVYNGIKIVGKDFPLSMRGR